MKKVVMLGLILMGLTGCESQPLTMQQRAALYNFGDDLQNFGQQGLQRQQQQPQFIQPIQQERRCTIQDQGGGYYRSVCENY
jgi:hypothetical protein